MAATVQELLAPYRTPTVLEIAESLRTSRDWSMLPVLADALEEAGFSDRTCLDHLRSMEEHIAVPVCHVVEAILG